MKRVCIRVDQNHMATTFEFKISCAPSQSRVAESVLREAHVQVARLEHELSEFIEHSPVARLNRTPPLERVAATQSLLELLEESERCARWSGGAFTPTSKSLADASGHSAELRTRVDWCHASRTVWRLHPSVKLGFGAIGKGFALDHIRPLIEREGFTDYSLSAGGSSLILSGQPEPGSHWQLGWSWQKGPDGAPLGIQLPFETPKPLAIGVSGTHEQGQHIVDPRSDRAEPQPALKSLMVIGDRATEADGLSTAGYVTGWEGALAIASRLPRALGLASIDADGVPSWTRGFAARLGAGLSLALVAVMQNHRALADDAVDLGALEGSQSFTPYLFERNWMWSLLPLAILAYVVLHLKRKRRRPAMKKTNTLPLILTLWSALELSEARAVEIEPMGKALQALLGTPKVFKKGANVFYAKNAAGKASAVAVIEKGIYEPNCTHTWAVGIDPATGKVTQVRALEMSCPHAFPCKAASFLDQYRGKGPADVAKLDSQINNVAKATGSAKLTTAAVQRSIEAFQKLKGTF